MCASLIQSKANEASLRGWIEEAAGREARGEGSGAICLMVEENKRMRSELAQLKGVVEGMKSYKDQAVWWEKNANDLSSQLDAAYRQLRESEDKVMHSEQRAHMEWQRAEAVLERKETAVDEIVRTRSSWEEERGKFLEQLSIKEEEMIALKHALEQRQSERDAVLEKYRHCLDQLDAAKADFEQHVASVQRQGQNGDVAAAALQDSNVYMLMFISTLKAALSQTELVNANKQRERERERGVELSRRIALEDAVHRMSQQMEQERRLHAEREKMHTMELAKVAELLEQEMNDVMAPDAEDVPGSGSILPESGEGLRQGHGQGRMQGDVPQQTTLAEELYVAKQEGAVWERQAHMLRTQVNALRAELDLVRLDGEGLQQQMSALSKDADRLRSDGDHWHNEAIRAYSELAALARKTQSMCNLTDWGAPVEPSPQSARENKPSRHLEETSLSTDTGKIAHTAPRKHEGDDDQVQQAHIQAHQQAHTQVARHGDTSPAMMQTLQQDLVLEKKARNDQCTEFDAIIKKLVDERDSLSNQVSRLSGEVTEYARASKEAHNQNHSLVEERDNLTSQVARLPADLAEFSQVEKEVHALRHKLEEAQRQLHALSAENGTLRGENNILRGEVATLQKDKESLRADNHTLTHGIESLRREHENLRLDSGRREHDVEKLHKQLQSGNEQKLEAHAQHQREMRVVTDKIEELSGLLDRSQHDVCGLTALCESLRSQLSAAAATERDAQQQEEVALQQGIDKHKDDIQLINSERDTLHSELAVCQQSLAALHGQSEQLQGQIEELSLQSESLRAELDATKNELNASKDDRDKLQVECHRLTAERDALCGQISLTQNQNEQCGEHVHQLATECDALRNELAVALCNRKQLDDDMRQLYAECDALRNQLLAVGAREEDASQLQMEIQRTVTDLVFEKKARMEDAVFFNSELEQLKNEVFRLNCQLMHPDIEEERSDHATMDVLEW